jgi:hypothetical protein
MVTIAPIKRVEAACARTEFHHRRLPPIRRRLKMMGHDGYP